MVCALNRVNRPTKRSGPAQQNTQYFDCLQGAQGTHHRSQDPGLCARRFHLGNIRYQAGIAWVFRVTWINCCELSLNP